VSLPLTRSILADKLIKKIVYVCSESGGAKNELKFCLCVVCCILNLYIQIAFQLFLIKMFAALIMFEI